jgi:hypothetical protein
MDILGARRRGSLLGCRVKTAHVCEPLPNPLRTPMLLSDWLSINMVQSLLNVDGIPGPQDGTTSEGQKAKAHRL